jgi:importin subunit beta-1
MQDIEPDSLEPKYTSAVLYTIYKNLNSNESEEMRSECLEALLFTVISLGFIMKEEDKKLSLMNMILGATQFPETKLKIKAIQCLTESAKYFYEELDTSMNNILDLTTQIIVSSSEREVIVQAYEFWLIICQTEAKLTSNGIISKNYIKSYEVTLFNLCLNTIQLRNRSEESDSDTWYPYKAAYELLKKISKCCTENLIKLVMEKISELINQDAKSKHTAMLLFSTIVSSSWPQVIETIKSSLNEIICNVNDPDQSTRLTTSHIMISIAKHHTRNLNNFNLLDFFISFIYETMKNSKSNEIICNMIYCLNLIALDFELGKSDCKILLY